MVNTLGLGGDGDDVFLLKDIETSFGFQLTQADVQPLRTVGDLFDVVRTRLASHDKNRRGCAGQMAFYRLRRAIHEMGCVTKLAPGTPLSTVSTLPPKKFFRALRSRMMLRLPHLVLGRVGGVGAGLLGIGFLALIGSSLARSITVALLGLLIGVVGIGLMRIDPGRIKPDCVTLGDLARKVAGLNFTHFAAAGAAYRETDVWGALLEIVSEHTALTKAEISRDTLLMPLRRSETVG